MTFRQKWENYWYHHKWHTVAAVFAVALVILFIKSFVSKKMPDLYMVYLSTSMITEENIEKFENDLAKDAVVGDADDDGNTIVYLEHMVSSFEVDGYTDSSTAQKIQTVMYGGQQTLMLVHQYALEDYDGNFENLSDRVKEGDKTFESPSEGFVCGISVEGNEYLESHGINTKDLYVAMRRRTPENIKKGKDKKVFDEAYKAMEFIMSRQR